MSWSSQKPVVQESHICLDCHHWHRLHAGFLHLYGTCPCSVATAREDRTARVSVGHGAHVGDNRCCCFHLCAMVTTVNILFRASSSSSFSASSYLLPYCVVAVACFPLVRSWFSVLACLELRFPLVAALCATSHTFHIKSQIAARLKRHLLVFTASELLSPFWFTN